MADAGNKATSARQGRIIGRYRVHRNGRKRNGTIRPDELRGNMELESGSPFRVESMTLEMRNFELR